MKLNIHEIQEIHSKYSKNLIEEFVKNKKIEIKWKICDNGYKCDESVWLKSESINKDNGNIEVPRSFVSSKRSDEYITFSSIMEVLSLYAKKIISEDLCNNHLLSKEEAQKMVEDAIPSKLGVDGYEILFRDIC